jgi:putative hydrolase of the HAD superfamily
MGISTVVFDFGNVLGFFSHRKSAEQVAAYTDMAPEAVLAYLYGGKLEEDYESGRLSTAVFTGMVRQTCRLNCTGEEFATAYSDMFWPNTGVCALVPRLKPRCRLFLLSNTNDLHYRQFCTQFADVLCHFDGLVLSHEVGVRKPKPGIYEACQRRAGRPAAECLFVDDLPTNVEAARACGWQGLTYRRGDDLGRELARLGVTT